MQYLKQITDPNLMYTDKSQYLYIADVMIRYPEGRTNALHKFLPLFRHHEIINENDVIGKFTYDYMFAKQDYYS